MRINKASKTYSYLLAQEELDSLRVISRENFEITNEKINELFFSVLTGFLSLVELNLSDEEIISIIHNKLEMLENAVSDIDPSIFIDDIKSPYGDEIVRFLYSITENFRSLDE